MRVTNPKGTHMLLPIATASSLKTLCLFTGWVDYAARKEAVKATIEKTADVFTEKTVDKVSKFKLAYTVEKTGATLAVLAKRDTAESPLFIYCHGKGSRVRLTEYVAYRAEKKAAKIAKAAEKAAALATEKAAEAALIAAAKGTN